MYVKSYNACEKIKKIRDSLVVQHLEVFFLGLGRATFFLARVGFRACGFGPGRARATGRVLRVDFGLEYFQFGPTSGQIWLSFLRFF